jgi:hypothetical protein
LICFFILIYPPFWPHYLYFSVFIVVIFRKYM